MSTLAKRPKGAVQKYNPEKGLKTIAVAETAEKYYRRAKDPEKLTQAVEVKLTAQREFVAWWDQQEKDKGGRPEKTRSRSGTGFHADAFGLDRKTLHRWRKKLGNEKVFEKTLAQAIQRCILVCEAKSATGADAHVAQNAGVSEWYTPSDIIERARDVLGSIDVDPASHKDAQKIVNAATYFDLKSDGLQQEWKGTVWLNPPYSQPLIQQFIEKLVQEFKARRTTAAISLTNNGTETDWGQLLLCHSSEVCFPRGRVRFWNTTEESFPLQGQMICYFGDGKEFFGRFGELGVVMDAHQ
ncbi:MAG TPA: DNA N-6-adenine-methyltransferase [Dehalococcoidia bacterium]|nr:DNA N-6-adenine-methyltransferase [Dehalococcoidia bacterium]